jgi:uncharacterized protein YjbI with pentapeptide repeats
MADERGSQIGQVGQDPGKKRPPLRSRLWAWTGFADKTLWEWLQLLGALAIPVVLAAAGLWFTAQQDARQQKIEDRRAQQAQKIENQRAESEQEIEEQRTQDVALQAYLDQMSSLMIGKNSLRDSEEDSEVRTLARARTLTVLGRLDPKRRTAVMQFLEEAKLVGEVDGKSPIIKLSDANLSGADLSLADLSGAYLSDANLSYANLSYAGLYDANLSGADLRKANLSYANLNGADLSYANLSYAMLAGADLSGEETNLNYANLSGAMLAGADLSYADLSEADLIGADLRKVNLSHAYVTFADLSYAILSGIERINIETLEQQAESLRGATMPDGTIYHGRYATRWFEPAVSFEGGEDWGLAAPETTDQVSIEPNSKVGQPLFIETRPKGGQLLFTNPAKFSTRLTPANRKNLLRPRTLRSGYPGSRATQT